MKGVNELKNVLMNDRTDELVEFMRKDSERQAKRAEQFQQMMMTMMANQMSHSAPSASHSSSHYPFPSNSHVPQQQGPMMWWPTQADSSNQAQGVNETSSSPSQMCISWCWIRIPGVGGGNAITYLLGKFYYLLTY